MSTLLCPKCQSTMRSYERSGVTVDRCTECGGLFLDRGEVERLVELEGAQTQPRRPEGDRWPGDRWERERLEGDRWRRHDDDDDWDDERHEGKFGRRRGRRGGFLGDFLDFG